MENSYANDDTGNLILLEHVNLKIPNQILATAFYVTAVQVPKSEKLR